MDVLFVRREITDSEREYLQPEAKEVLQYIDNGRSAYNGYVREEIENLFLPGARKVLSTQKIVEHDSLELYSWHDHEDVCVSIFDSAIVACAHETNHNIEFGLNFWSKSTLKYHNQIKAINNLGFRLCNPVAEGIIISDSDQWLSLTADPSCIFFCYNGNGFYHFYVLNTVEHLKQPILTTDVFLKSLVQVHCQPWEGSSFTSHERAIDRRALWKQLKLNVLFDELMSIGPDGDVYVTEYIRALLYNARLVDKAALICSAAFVEQGLRVHNLLDNSDDIADRILPQLRRYELTTAPASVNNVSLRPEFAKTIFHETTKTLPFYIKCLIEMMAINAFSPLQEMYGLDNQINILVEEIMKDIVV